ncbi:nascent polypeptide-associated complex subunit alpha, muscle-specific form-like [Amphibalanus amphitrite]|uniref:nascent polypeptide-associated complex subunit alpha, muscle-specific form-like n=1 Tax=Amphibalanus amphitrite TaxID=1232801 RepID=UPI001C91B5B8|nr:nascent polypeptide-associated complex subunit alpha, muscle-specific form-like [Amphibalanus amphitrite]
MKKTLIQELTALLERQTERAAEADKRLERLERLLYREPSAGTGTGTTAGVSESGAERGADESVGPAAAARRTVCLPASATPAPHLKSTSTCKARVECSVRDSETRAVSRLEDSEPTLRHAVTVGETWSAHATCQDLCGTKGHFVAHLPAYKRGRRRPSVAHAAAETSRQFLERCPTCGRRQHAGGDTCRAAGAICRACGEPGHFEVVCHQRASTTADRPVATSAVTRVRDSPGVALVAVAAGTAVSPPPADTGPAGHTALQPTELSDAADVHGASPPPAGGWPTQTTDSNEAPDNAVSPPPADTGRIGCAAEQPTEPDGATGAYGASPPPAGGIPTCSTDGVYGASPPPPTEPADAHGASPSLTGSLPTRTSHGNEAAGDAVLPPPADTGQPGATAVQPAGPDAAAVAYGASPPPAGGLQTLSTGRGAAAGPAVSPPTADTGQIGCTAAQSTRPAAAYGASPPPAGGLPTRTRDGGTAAGYAVSPLPGDTSQADCCAAQPTELSKTTDVYGASPPPAGGMPTRSTDGGPAASTAESPPPAGTGQAGCSHAAQPTELADAYGASPPPAGGLPVRSGDGDPPEQMVAAHAAAQLLHTPQRCVSAGDKSDRRGDTNLGDTTLHSVEVVDDLLGPTVDDEVWEDAEDPLHAAAVAAMLAERDTECDSRLPPLVAPSLRVTRAAADRDPWPLPTPERRLPRTSPCDGGRVRCKKRPRRRGRERRRRRLHRAAVALCARTPEGPLWRLGVKTM